MEMYFKLKHILHIYINHTYLVSTYVHLFIQTNHTYLVSTYVHLFIQT